MPTTSNFGWNTPADTDLVKDGAAAIRTLGNNIDASLVDLKGGTTGQVLAKASNADLDYTWSNVDPLTILDAKGDLITATAADTPARLAVGTNGQYLQADSTTSTGLKWATLSAGGMTLLSTTTLNATTINITGISQNYKKLVGYIKNPRPSTGANYNLRYNNISTTTYNSLRWGSTAINSVALDSTGIFLLPDVRNQVSTGFYIFEIEDYANTGTIKVTKGYGYSHNDSNAANFSIGTVIGFSSATSAITELNIFVTGGGTQTSGTLELYGVN